MSACVHCAAPTTDGQNYCGQDCWIGYAKAAGGRVHTPNGLPIRCIKADGTMLECEHGDHPTYLFPVTVEHVGPREWLADGQSGHPETHALIYTDGTIAVTLHECRYATWSLPDGEWREADVRGEWRLSPASVAAIAAHVARRPDPSPG